MQFSLCSLRRILAGLDSACDHVPVAALRWRSMEEKNLATAAPRHEGSDLGTYPHRRSLGNNGVRASGDIPERRRRAGSASSTAAKSPRSRPSGGSSEE
jgi:hypothetical protein